ncbi:trypsin-like peptidase domain-containing protein [Streptomyces sp. E2N166]|uniref:nSTAND1 domain-containing NTPase n=1 Tax=Streptomyces sp. E2N166 TaxID=1851909 RepID=UPI000EF6B07D|nr:trypsin-like peptidase domain-containing protein [Streptomyces sp. E2N166]
MYDQDESGRTAAGAGHGKHEDADTVLASGTVRLRDGHGDSAGTGFLVGDGLVLTCAHVVCDALGKPRDTEVLPGTRVTLDMPLLAGPGAPGHDIEAEVAHWVPIREDRSGDVAVLRLLAPAPGARPLPTSLSRHLWEHGSRIVGFTGHSDRPVWQRGSLLGPAGKGWVQLSRADGQTVRVTGGFSGSPVWDNALGAVVGMIVAAEPVRDDQQAYMLHLGALADEIPALAEAFLAPTPFPGLEPFREEDADVFFGREEDTESVVRALRGDRAAVTLCGPSGCGKSSLALAGVAPVMRRAGHEVVVIHCGRTSRPVDALAVELLELARQKRFGPPRATGVERVVTWLTGAGLADTVHRLTGTATTDLLVVLDQAEALLDLPDEALTALLSVLFPARRTAGMRVLLTLRADFIDAALSHEHLGPVLKRGAVLPLTPMTREQLHAVITRPVDRLPGVSYEPGLARRILEDAGSEPGALPLLSFVLRHLWEEQSGGRLRVEAYEKAGGVSGALRRHAEEAWRKHVPSVTETGSPDPADAPEIPDPMEAVTQARRLLAGLVRVVPGSGAPALRRVLTRAEAGEQRWHLAVLFAGKDERLLVLHGGAGAPESVELAHEALITAWPTLSEVVREDRDFLAARAELQHDRERWERAGRADELLPRGAQLVFLESRLAGRTDELTASETELLDLAAQQRHAIQQQHRARQRRIRWAWAGGSLSLALIATLIVFSIQESRVSKEREAEGRSRSLAVQADELADTNPAQAALAAIAGYDTSPTQEARNALLRRYTSVKEKAWLLSGVEGKIDSVAMSANGAVTLATSDTRRATLFLRTKQGKVRQVNLRLRPNVQQPTVSLDGRRIAYVRDEDRAVVWRDVTPTAKYPVGPAHLLKGPPVKADPDDWGNQRKLIDFSRTSRYLVEAAADSTTFPVRVWDLKTGRHRDLPKIIPGIKSIWFGPDDTTLMAMGTTSSYTEMMDAVDIRTGTRRRLVTDGKQSGVSSDGTVVITCHEGDSESSAKALYQTIRVADRRILRGYRSDNTTCETTVLDAKGDRFALTGYGDTWEIVNASGNERPRKVIAPSVRRHDLSPELPLLGSEQEPVLAFKDDISVSGHTLVSADGATAYGVPRLLGDGRTVLVRLGEKGDTLRVMETEGDNRDLAEVSVKAKTPPAKEQVIAINSAETLMADVSDKNRVTIRRLPSLRRVSEFKTAVEPPVVDRDPHDLFTPPGDVGELEPVDLVFLPGDRLVTVVGSLVEQWDTRKGRRLSSIDLKDLRLTSQNRPEYHVTPHRDPGLLAVSVGDEPDLHAVDLRTGQKRKDLRIRFADNFLTAYFLKDTRYMAVLTSGRILELWSVEPGQRPRRVAAFPKPLRPGEWATGNPNGAHYFLAADSSVTFLKADDPSYRETYEFAENQSVISATRDGKALFGSPTPESSLDALGKSPLSLTRLDPILWKRHLCKVIGRGLTDDERRGLPGQLPDKICTT